MYDLYGISDIFSSPIALNDKQVTVFNNVFRRSVSSNIRLLIFEYIFHIIRGREKKRECENTIVRCDFSVS